MIVCRKPRTGLGILSYIHKHNDILARAGSNSPPPISKTSCVLNFEPTKRYNLFLTESYTIIQSYGFKEKGNDFCYISGVH
jgi:hypothetical protein